jgi:hypothetical protein
MRKRMIRYWGIVLLITVSIAVKNGNSCDNNINHGDDQIRALWTQGNDFKDSYDDMNFTPPYLSTITARTLIVPMVRSYCTSIQ